MITVRHLQIHATHSCNLACESCSHYSNHNHAGILSLDEAESWISCWQERFTPELFTILGGEPTLNPQLPELVRLANRYWPNATIRIVTNGFFLPRHPTLPLVLKEISHTELCVSIHHNSPEYQERLQPIKELLNQWVEEHKIWVQYYSSHGKWTQRYTGYGAEMEPFSDGDQRASWEICPARYCMQLFEGKLWKCGPLAYLKMQDEKYGLSENWQPYLAYRPLESTCSDEELVEFIGREDEFSCTMCSATPRRLELPLPFRQAQGSIATPPVAQPEPPQLPEPELLEPAFAGSAIEEMSESQV